MPIQGSWSLLTKVKVMLHVACSAPPLTSAAATGAMLHAGVRAASCAAQQAGWPAQGLCVLQKLVGEGGERGQAAPAVHACRAWIRGLTLACLVGRHAPPPRPFRYSEPVAKPRLHK